MARDRLAEHHDTADDVERRYGVPAEILVAIWAWRATTAATSGDFSTRGTRQPGL
ncbi:hypothetical protein DSL92_05875 [Billgrantia gudaonensis]|uniref:Transglycosylase SLT domain-containing protein n=1 Tax=Billgrantia gudaonensis TaxID=376427 RepID=A0A432JJ67_9GAMM|nr:hypothetical protein DSL92_05875 [Halomonas gudaonensis]